jgi:hypothetical protein
MTVCTLDRCRCPACGVTELLLRAKFPAADRERITVTASDLGSCSYPYLATVRVDGTEVYRIHARPDEVFAADVLADIERRLRADAR